MRTFPLALAATGAMLASTIAAHATPPKPGPGFQGCHLVVAADQTPDGELGGPDVYNGFVYSGPVVIADTDDVFANAVDGTLHCKMYINGFPRGDVGDSGQGSYVVAVAQRATYTAAPGDDVKVCATLDLTNAHGEQASYDLGCEAPTVLPGTETLCTVTQFLPLPVRPLVEQYLGC